MNKRWDIKYLLMACALVLLVAPWAWAQQGKDVATVYVVGDSPISGDDMSTSRKASIDSGLIAAVTNVLTDMVPREVLVGNFQILNDNILNQAEKFVRNYKVLTESTQGKRHRVMVQASVSSQRLKRALKKAGIYLGRKRYPRVLFCVAEKEMGEVNFQYWWGEQPQWREGEASRSVRKIFKNKGFMIVMPRKGQAAWNYPPELTTAEAVAMGNQLGAQVVVVGQAVVDEATNTMGSTIQSFRGTITARAYRVETSEEMAQSQRSAVHASDDPRVGVIEALRNAASLTGEDLAVQIAESWFSKESGLARTELSIEGIGGQIANFVKFRGALSTMSGVESVQLTEMMPDTAILSVEYQGSVSGLVAGLLRQNFSSFGINIVETTGSMVRLQLVSR